MTAAPIHLRGERLLLDPSGALVWPARRLMVVADLHLEKGSAAATRGQLLPPWDTSTTLERLHQVLRLYHPQTVVLLGDSFHDTHAPGRMRAADQARLLAMLSGRDCVWVLGNHDPALPTHLPGQHVAELSLASLLLRHQAVPGAALGTIGEICGHHHPKARIVTRAGSIARPCFIADARRIILPAFGAYTGGLDVHDPAIAGLFPRGGRVFLRGRDRLFSFALSHAQPDTKTGSGRLRRQTPVPSAEMM